MMIKKIAGTIAAIAAAAMMTTTAFAGEWVTLNDGRKYYNTGYDQAYHGWQWIYENDGVARCYYFDENGCALTNTTTPDGYKVDYTGAWVKNGKVVTIDYQDGMAQDTNWANFGGDYYMYQADYNNGTTSSVNRNANHVYISNVGGACSVYNYSTGTTTIFYNRNSTYSWESGDGQLLDVANEDWFRMITPSGTFYYSR